MANTWTKAIRYIHGRLFGFTNPNGKAGQSLIVPFGTIGVSNSTGTAASGAVTHNDFSGVITSEALTTAAAATYTLTITNSNVEAGDSAYASVQFGTATAGLPSIASITLAAGTLTIVVRNAHASNAFNGTIKVSYLLLKN